MKFPKYYLWSTYFTCLVGCFIVLWWGYESSFLWFNHFRALWADYFFLYFTLLGDGWLLAMLAFIFLRQNGWLTTIALLATAIIITLFKHWLFPTWGRPLSTLSEVYALPPYLYYKSFPSGHAMAAACFAYFWAQTYRKQQLWAWVFVWLVAYSRVYVGAHFLGDVITGTAIGTTLSLSIALYQNYFNKIYPSFLNQPWSRYFFTALFLLRLYYLLASLN